MIFFLQSQKTFKVLKSNYKILAIFFSLVLLKSFSENACLHPHLSTVGAFLFTVGNMFSVKSFQMLGLTLRLFIHFTIVFCQMRDMDHVLFFSHMEIQLSGTIFEKMPFPCARFKCILQNGQTPFPEILFYSICVCVFMME